MQRCGVGRAEKSLWVRRKGTEGSGCGWYLGRYQVLAGTWSWAKGAPRATRGCARERGSWWHQLGCVCAGGGEQGAVWGMSELADCSSESHIPLALLQESSCLTWCAVTPA